MSGANGYSCMEAFVNVWFRFDLGYRSESEVYYQLLGASDAKINVKEYNVHFLVFRGK
jgi:acyl-coenzyme A synthetase/AMP-(fatty) acid ligase